VTARDFRTFGPKAPRGLAAPLPRAPLWTGIHVTPALPPGAGRPATLSRGMADPVVLVSVTVSVRGAPVASVSAARDVSAPAPAEAVDTAPYSHGYTGRHDGGPLPPQRTDTGYGHLLSAVVEAKAATDAELIKLVPPPAAAAAAAPPAAKVRGESGGEREATVGNPAPATPPSSHTAMTDVLPRALRVTRRPDAASSEGGRG
jgi:hypothetical protein